MSAPFNLNFIIPVQPLITGCDFSSLVPYEAAMILPVDEAGFLPPSIIQRLKAKEQLKCNELKKLSVRLGGDAIHFVVGFKLEDYKQVAVTDVVRRHRVRETVCSLLRSVETEHEAESIESLVAMHLDCEIPHVHVAMSRYASSGAMMERINTLPAALLPLN